MKNLVRTYTLKLVSGKQKDARNKIVPNGIETLK